ncbi:MAG: thioredoxin domain-containing protein [bacterium]|nr:thioredoxin domain-containing protein [bacterium]
MEEQQDQQQNLTKRERKELRRQEKTEAKDQVQRSKTMKRWITWLSVIVGIAIVVGGFVWAVVNSNPAENTPLADTVVDTDWTKGNQDASVVLVEYSDLQCPACASYEPMIKQVIENFSEDVLFVYRHFPLKSIHPNAEEAGWAAEAAGQQDAFWEMHDILFNRQTAWSALSNPKDTFIDYAKELGLNAEQFDTDYESDTARDKVNSDYQSGVRSSVQGTPTFFINGETISNPRTYDEFANIITNALGSAE